MRVLLAFIVMACLPAHGADIRRIDVDRSGARYYVDSETVIDAPIESVYAVLIDYEHFERISSVFTDSRFVEPIAGGRAVVYTRAEGCIVFFCRTVVRVDRLELDPFSDIVAIADPALSDVKYSRAHWQLDQTEQGTRILYRHEMEPDFWIPPVIGPWLIKRSLTSNGLEAVTRIELLARERVSATAGTRP